MRRFFGRKQNDKIIIENDDFKHLKNVLRLGVGAEVIVSLNDEFEYICEIENIVVLILCKRPRISGGFFYFSKTAK